ncbi:serine protease [Microcoleus sp. D2_18a_B4]|uniref:serine protease n=1 Tax=Microcoleus sp. D2_18a_B4 TaxID=3055329 RepID=UPI002FD24732
MNLHSWRYKLRLSYLLIACIGCWYTQQPVQSLPVSESRLIEVNDRRENAQELTVAQIKNEARAIAVKVLSGYGAGSGILIKKQGETYTILTNNHVLAVGESHRIQTPDGKIYHGELLKNRSFDGNDLVLLQFRSTREYSVARLASSPVEVGDEVFATGFPGQEGSEKRGFEFLLGTVSLLSPKALVGGYQIGYSNPVEKGMSGGPLLNSRGEVVGINGMHAYPLWGDPYVFKDGSKPNLPRDLMIESSWAIPIETFVQLGHKSAGDTPRRTPYSLSPPVISYPQPQGEYGDSASENGLLW